MNNELIPITWSNYKDVQAKIDSLTTHYEMTAVTYTLWQHYGAKVFFKVEENAVYFFIEVKNDDHDLNTSFIKKPIYHIIISPVTNDLKNYRKYFDRSVELFKANYPNETEIYFESLGYNIKTKLQPIFEWTSSYIYHTNDLRTFAGKKMQKKRNHLNYFKQHFLDKTNVIKYSKEYQDDVLKFLKHEVETSETTGDFEYDAIVALLNNFDDETMSGCIVFYDGKIIGVTIGILNHNIYELILERGTKDFRGVYQFIISSNLEINDIKVPYINREDDAGMENIRKSKKSYQPCLESTCKVYKIN